MTSMSDATLAAPGMVMAGAAAAAAAAAAAMEAGVVPGVAKMPPELLRTGVTTVGAAAKVGIVTTTEDRKGAGWSDLCLNSLHL